MGNAPSQRRGARFNKLYDCLYSMYLHSLTLCQYTFNIFSLDMSILFSNFAVRKEITFSPPETRLIGTYMMIIELGTYCTDADVQKEAIKEINTLTSDYTTPIEVNGLWNNYIVIKSLIMCPTVANDFVINLVTLIQTRNNLDHYYFNEVTIKREKPC